MLGAKIKLYSSKYFIQYNSEAKNNLHPLFLQEIPAKDSLLLFTIYLYPRVIVVGLYQTLHEKCVSIT